MRHALFALSFLPLPALAQDLPSMDLNDLPYLSEATVQGGRLAVESAPADYYVQKQLTFNGQPVPGISDVYVDIQAVIPAGSEDWVFVTLANGGNACPTMWAIVATSDAGARSTGSFGYCSEAIMNLRREGEGIAFEAPSLLDGTPDVTFYYDGTLTMAMP